MTTSILTNLLGPICEMFYKYNTSLQTQSANINTIRNYGFSTSFALNFGFEIYEPFDLNNIQLQPGVYTYNNSYNVFPNLDSQTTIDVLNLIKVQDLPSVGFGTVTFVNKTMPLKISIQQSGSSLIGIASAFETDGIPFDSNYNLEEPFIRAFESKLVNDSELVIFILLYMANTSFEGNQLNWSVKPTSLYQANIQTFRYSNGFGQFYSFPANNSFVDSNLSINLETLNQTFNSTYAMVYNWINYLDWIPDFNTWYDLNKNTLPDFLHEFLIDYFGFS